MQRPTVPCRLMLSALILLVPLAGSTRAANRPAPPAAESYSELRALPGAAGRTATLESPTDARLNGTFAWQAADPYGHGDDGGIVLRAPNGFWVRRFAHTRDEPVRLDWFTLEDGSDVTGLIAALGAAFAPALYLQCPTRPVTLVWDYVEWTDSMEVFHLTAGHPGVVFEKKGDTADRGHRKTMLALRGYREVVIEPGITFDGSYDRIGGSSRGDPAEQGGGWALLDFAARPDAELLDVRCDTRAAPAFGINHAGSASRVQRAVIGGRHVDSGLRLNSGIRELHFADACVSDPRAKGLGYVPRGRVERWMAWLAAAKGAEAARLQVAQNNWSDDGSHAQVKDLFEKTRGVWMQNCDRITGKVTLQYGNAHWFMSGNADLGVSESHPFVIEYRDLGYTDDGVPVPTTGFLAPAGKPDALRDTGPGHRFVRLVSNGRNNLRYSLVVEATREAPQHRTYRTNHVHWECVGLTKPVNLWVVGRGDEVRGHTLTGRVDSRIISGIENTLQDLAFAELDLVYKKHTTKYKGDPPEGSTAEEGAHGNAVRNCTLLPGGQIRVEHGTHHNTVAGLTVEGQPRRIVYINNSGDPARPVSLELSAFSGPGLKGSTIEADDWTNVTCTLDGRQLTADHRF